MNRLSTSEIRERYLKFFEGKGHLVLDSYPLVPKDDKSLLLINAGMAPLKAYFTGVKTPPSTRIATCQKCIRTGDIDNVGRTKRHATFFEMLGNFSFGDYFKEEIIPWAWEFVTKELEIPTDKLYVTIYFEDDEAFEIWKNKTNIDPARIFRLGKEDNFWEIGVGPCGPCSEIHYYKADGVVTTTEEFIEAGERDEMVEFWNLVFTQFDKDEEGNYNRLAAPNIDTGMGLERMATIMQGVKSIFEIDILKNIIESVVEITGRTYGEDEKTDISIRIIADHAKSVAFLISDGVLPSNEGRGYVMRRLLRRAARHGKVLGSKGKFLNHVIEAVIESYKDAYPDLLDRKSYINKIVALEEEKFLETIDQGTELLNGYIAETSGDVFSGAHAFKLYDTYGFPLELTEEILAEKGMKVDFKAFKEEMELQRQRARSARGESNYMGGSLQGIDTFSEHYETEFVGYNVLEADVEIIAVSDGAIEVEKLSAGSNGYIVTNKTPFYAEMGGQVGDTGLVTGKGFRAEVTDTRKSRSGNTVHAVTVIEGELSLGEAVLSVDKARRTSIQRNHTATHILHKALKIVLGDHVNQAGSIVLDEKLRFDFNHFQGATAEELKKIEEIVNEEILMAMPVKTDIMDMVEAKKSGAMALFDEKYGDEVRVLSVGDFSRELCGGTHVRNSGEIGLFRIVSESGIASGVRRIEAVTGMNSYRLSIAKEELLESVAETLKSSEKDLLQKASANVAELKARSKEIEELKRSLSKGSIDTLISSREDIGGVSLVRGEVKDADASALREITEKVLDKLKSGVVALASVDGQKVNFSVMVSKDLTAKGLHAGKMIKEIAAVAGGGGGGRPDMAQAGGKNPEKTAEALQLVHKLIETVIK
ncbi:alanine--tRNA ligase [Youngiibacter multivorans]|uniref:Alanine--tRNA ligase n=1 Tax=Youngiibacter multivorans TaxID=937251 RepID=A0ABS4G630_9CLOT|nr:alanine--tRNA ligase [Youngiibacter multivorans]MBP1920035.1 alanyl-tRNA synthetase [Youngiibacter multivorans]